jgi:CHRD domain-containing protein
LELQRREVLPMKMQNKHKTRYAGFVALLFSLAVIVTSCGGEVGELPGTDAVPRTIASPAVTITVPLSGEQHVPPVATAGTGSGVLSVNLATGAFSGTVIFSGLSSVATAAHIHEGAAGLNGPIIIPLDGAIGVTNGTFTVPAGTVMTAAQLNALQIGGLYIQIHTLTFPGGELRGQMAVP